MQCCHLVDFTFIFSRFSPKLFYVCIIYLKKNKNLIIAMLPLWPRFLQGTCSEAPYAFYHWHHIDIFNYFTHTLVTIPPAVWTSAAHKHGVVVIGE